MFSQSAHQIGLFLKRTADKLFDYAIPGNKKSLFVTRKIFLLSHRAILDPCFIRKAGSTKKVSRHLSNLLIVDPFSLKV